MPLCRLDKLNVLAHIQPRLHCGLSRSRRSLPVCVRPSPLASGRARRNGRPSPSLYLATWTAALQRRDLLALIDRLHIFHNDLKLLHRWPTCAIARPASTCRT